MKSYIKFYNDTKILCKLILFNIRSKKTVSWIWNAVIIIFVFASDKQYSNTNISLLNRESRPCFAGIGCIKPMLNKITERSMRLKRKRKELVACLWIFRFREHRLSILSREIIQSSWTGQMGRICISSLWPRGSPY